MLISKSLIGNTRAKGFRHSEETKQKLKEINTKKTVSDEFRNKMSKINKGRTLPKHVFDALQLGKQIYDNSIEGKTKQSENCKKQWKNYTENERQSIIKKRALTLKENWANKPDDEKQRIIQLRKDGRMKLSSTESCR